MQNLGPSVLLAVIVAVVLVAGLRLFGDRGAPEVTAADIAALRDDLSSLRDDLAGLRDKLAAIESTPEPAMPIASTAARRPAPENAEQAADTPGDAPPPSLDISSDAFRQHIFSLIEEERELADVERRRQVEERRNQREEFRQGPYGDYNLRVNSMAKVVGLDDAQREEYYELTKRHWEELKELRTNTNWRDAEGRTKYREAQDRIQEEYASAVEALLTPGQLETYREIPNWAQGLQSLGEVPAPGEGIGAFTRMRSVMEGMRGRSRVQRSATGSP
jgi:hypothetical protein